MALIAAESDPQAQLDPVGADLHAVLRTQPPGDGDFAGVRQALVDARSRAVGRQSHAFELDGDVGDAERDRLAVGNRFAERLALGDIRRDVVEHRLGGSEGDRAPGEPREPDTLGVGVGTAVPRRASAPTTTSSSSSRLRPAARSPIDGSASIRTPGVDDSTTNNAGAAPSTAAATMKSSAAAPRTTPDLTPVRV